MFDGQWIEGLTANEAADELAGARDLLLAAEATQLLLAIRWADLHDHDYVQLMTRSLPGMPRLVAAGPAEGCPQIDEYAGAELAALLGMSTRAGEALIADAVTLRVRHPHLFDQVKACRVRVWVARKVATRCTAAMLNPEQARLVDAATTPYAASLPVTRFLHLVDAAIIEVDPERAETRAQAAALSRHVTAGRIDEQGMRTLVARAHAGDVVHLLAVLDRISAILAAHGDPDPADVRRVTALRVLANPARALALLTGASLEALVPHTETATDVAADVHPGGDAAWMRDAHGNHLGYHPETDDLIDDPDLDLALGGLLGGSVGSSATLDLVEEPSEPDPLQLSGMRMSPVVGVDRSGHGFEESLDPQLMQALLTALATFDASRLDPACVLHVHLTDTTLAARAGVTRVESLGAATLGQVRDWLVHPTSPDQIRAQVTVQGILDSDAARPVDAYEWPTRMSELATARTPFEVWPYGTLRSRQCDNDHVEPYRHEDPPPGQTRLSNLAKLGRKHHRIKTNGGWRLLHPEPGIHRWRTRCGHWFQVDTTGTRHLGRRPDLDAELGISMAAAAPAVPAA